LPTPSPLRPSSPTDRTAGRTRNAPGHTQGDTMIEIGNNLGITLIIIGIAFAIAWGRRR
jgi:hypothetical protein